MAPRIPTLPSLRHSGNNPKAALRSPIAPKLSATPGLPCLETPTLPFHNNSYKLFLIYTHSYATQSSSACIRSSLGSYGPMWISLHAIPTIKRPSSRLLQQISTWRSCGCENHTRIIRLHAFRAVGIYIPLFQRKGKKKEQEEIIKSKKPSI